MTVQDEIIDARSRDAAYMIQFGNKYVSQHQSLIQDMIDDLIIQLNIRTPEDQSLTAKRLRAMLKQLEELNRDLYQGLYQQALEFTKEASEFESQATYAAVQNSYPIDLKLDRISPSKIHSAVRARPFQGKLLKDWYSEQSVSSKRKYRQAVKLGYTNGETITQIARRIKDVADIEKRQAEALTRTALNHTSNVAMQDFTQANKAVISKEMMVATLDGRTSPICRGIDGKEFEIGKGPYPPLHINCRTIRVPKTKTWKELGFDNMKESEALSNRPFVADKRKVKDIPIDDRQSIIGNTSDLSYNDWLRKQPKSFVADVLGKSKAELYLKGGLTLDKFVNRQGVYLTLPELMGKYKSSFEKAGLI